MTSYTFIDRFGTVVGQVTIVEADTDGPGQLVHRVDPEPDRLVGTERLQAMYRQPLWLLR